MPDNHLTGWRVLGAMTSLAGLGAGGQEMDHPGTPSPSPTLGGCGGKRAGLSQPAP